jgi:hypothetical protein
MAKSLGQIERPEAGSYRTKADCLMSMHNVKTFGLQFSLTFYAVLALIFHIAKQMTGIIEDGSAIRLP